MPNIENDVIVIGTEHHNTLGMVRCFAMVNIPVILLLYGCESSYIAKLKNIKNTYYFDEPEHVIDYLKRNKLKKNDDIIISCTDTISLLINECNVLKSVYKFFNISNGSNMKNAMDKYFQTMLAGELGLSVPKSIVLSTKKELDNYEGDLFYPCIIKPLVSVNGGKHIDICHNKVEITNALETFSGEDLLVQEQVKRESEIVVLGLALKNEIIVPAYIEKIRDYNGGTTFSKTYSTNKLPNEFMAKIRKFVERLSYQGLFGIEFICRNEDLYFIEINLRNDATTYSAAVAGVNLPYIYYLSMQGLDINAEKFKCVDEIYSIVELNDFVHTVMRGKFSVTKWFKQYHQSKCRYYCAKEGNLLTSALISKIRNKLT